MSSFTIRPVLPQDIALLAQLSSSTFYDAFAHLNKAGDVEHYISETYNEENLSLELSNPDSAFYFLESGGATAGYMKLNFGGAQSEYQEAVGMEVARLYVDKSFQNQHLGTRLIQYAIECAINKKCTYLWLGVWEHNSNAIRFYNRMGFDLIGQHKFLLGSDLQTDLLMRRDL